MATEREKMLAGQGYDPNDQELVEARLLARQWCHQLNASDPRDEAGRRALVEKIFAKGGNSVWLEPPFYCDYGTHIELGEKVFLNFNCVILDVARVKIGDHTLIGPAVQIYTAMHPLDAKSRRQFEFGKPVEIGNDVWIGGGAIICPGVSIGSESVIGAGSVVTRDIPPGMLAVGNPCRVISRIDERE